jgi:hypothetical protein
MKWQCLEEKGMDVNDRKSGKYVNLLINLKKHFISGR